MAQSKSKLLSRIFDGKNGVARYDMGIGLASIAKPTARNMKREEFIINQKWNEGKMEIMGLTLDDFDISVLLSIIAIATAMEAKTKNGNDAGITKIDDKQKKGRVNMAENLPVFTLKTSYGQIVDVMNWSKSGTLHADIWMSIKRLAMITVDIKTPDLWAFTHLIHAGLSNENSQTIEISLNFRLTSAIMGESSYAAIDMNVLNKLPRGVARIMYVWLASWYGAAAGKRSIGYEKLAEHVWGKEEVDTKTNQKRREYLKVAANKISQKSAGKWGFETGLTNLIIDKQCYKGELHGEAK